MVHVNDRGRELCKPLVLRWVTMYGLEPVHTSTVNKALLNDCQNLPWRQPNLVNINSYGYDGFIKDYALSDYGELIWAEIEKENR